MSGLAFGAIVTFVTSLAGIIGLFILKAWEVKHERIVLAEPRTTLDTFALMCKREAMKVGAFLDALPGYVSVLSRFFVFRSMRGFAHLARNASESANRLADFVSHKHSFERRETRSQFLKEMGAYKGKDERTSQDGADKENLV